MDTHGTGLFLVSFASTNADPTLHREGAVFLEGESGPELLIQHHSRVADRDFDHGKLVAALEDGSVVFEVSNEDSSWRAVVRHDGSEWSVLLESGDTFQGIDVAAYSHVDVAPSGWVAFVLTDSGGGLHTLAGRIGETLEVVPVPDDVDLDFGSGEVLATTSEHAVRGLSPDGRAVIEVATVEGPHAFFLWTPGDVEEEVDDADTADPDDADTDDADTDDADTDDADIDDADTDDADTDDAAAAAPGSGGTGPECGGCGVASPTGGLLALLGFFALGRRRAQTDQRPAGPR